MAGRVRVSTLRWTARLCAPRASTLAMRRMSASGLADVGNGTAQHKAAAHAVVLGGVPHDNRHTRRLGAVAAAPARTATIRNRLAAAPQAPASYGQCRPRAPARGRRGGRHVIGGPQPGLRGSRQLKGRRAALVLVAVEKRGHGSGRVRLAVIPDVKAATLTAFLTQNVAPGSTVYTDGLKSFTGLGAMGLRHIPRTQPLRTALRQRATSAVPLADRAIGNLQQWLIGTYHGVSRRSSRSIWTSSPFDTIAVGHRWRPFRHCSASVRRAHPLHCAASAVARICRNRATTMRNHNIWWPAETTDKQKSSSQSR